MWWFSSKKTYSKESVVYILNEILRQTVDRETLKRMIFSEMRPLVGEKVIDDFYKKTNDLEAIVDAKKTDYWIDKLNKLNKEKIM